MTAPATIEAATDQGTGLILPISKALTHIMSIYTATTREWPMTVADATAELDAASGHLRDAVIPAELMTDESVTAINGWIAHLNEQLNAVRNNTNHEAQLAEALNIDELKQIASNTWQLLTNLDRELTGLEPNNTDPGRLP
jgi:hypothetical protein